MADFSKGRAIVLSSLITEGSVQSKHSCRPWGVQAGGEQFVEGTGADPSRQPWQLGGLARQVRVLAGSSVCAHMHI